jgi:hypothetical protein
MNSLISMKILSRRLILISAATLITANTVVAANRFGDAQMQARDLLTGTIEGTKATDRSPAISAVQHRQTYPEPQEQARQLILGKPSTAPASARSNDRIHTDPQELARRMILGEGGAGREDARVRLSAVREVKK